MIKPVEYLHWAKTHPRARYELSSSGVPPVSADELASRLECVETTVTGAYGHPTLIEQIADRYGARPDQVLPVTGTSTANFVALASVTHRGDAVALEWPAYEPLLRVIELLGLRPLRFQRPASADFAPDVGHIRQLLQSGARTVLLTDLHNPSGRLCPLEILHEIANACAEHGVTLVIDEVYREFAHLNRGLPRHTTASLGPHVVATNSLTKVYGFGGLRVGWLIGSLAVVERARAVVDHLFVDLPAPSASLAIRVLERIDRFAHRTREIYNAGIRIFSEWTASQSNLHWYGSDGAVFAYLRLPKDLTAAQFCQTLRSRYDTQVVPGTFFEQPDHIRVGLGVPEDELSAGLERIGLVMADFTAHRAG
jgi:aspartate/methionine/tyrosine aminotransferase